MARTRQTKRVEGTSGLAPRKKLVDLTAVNAFTTYEATACVRTWSEAFSHACPNSEEEVEEEQQGPPATRGQLQGSASNEQLRESWEMVVNVIL